MTFSYEDCPYCGEPGILEEIPMWYGDFGAPGHHKYRIACFNRHCEVQPHTELSDDVGRSKEVAIACVVFRWDQIVKAVTDTDAMFESEIPL